MINKRIENFKPQFAVLVVYKSKEGYWSGFCAPYDVTCQAGSKEKAMKNLESLVELYEKELAEFGYPKHLSLRPLSLAEDKKVLREIWPKVYEEITKEFPRDFMKAQVEIQKKSELVLKPPQARLVIITRQC